MISFEPLWNTMQNKGITTYALVNKHGMSWETISRMKHNKFISTKTLNDICIILNCNVSEVIEFLPEETV